MSAAPKAGYLALVYTCKQLLQCSTYYLKCSCIVRNTNHARSLLVQQEARQALLTLAAALPDLATHATAALRLCILCSTLSTL